MKSQRTVLAQIDNFTRYQSHPIVSDALTGEFIALGQDVLSWLSTALPRGRHIVRLHVSYEIESLGSHLEEEMEEEKKAKEAKSIELATF